MSQRGNQNGIRASLPNILDFITSADNKIQAIREVDLPQLGETMRARFNDIEDQNVAMIQVLQELAQQTPGVEEPREFGLLFYPPGEKPRSDPADVDLSNLSRQVGRGIVTIDFRSGDVSLPDGTTESLSQSLGGLNANTVSAISALADDNVLWWIPQEESGTFSRSFEIEGGDLTQLYVQTFSPTKLSVLGSTGREIAATRPFSGKKDPTPPTFASWDEANTTSTVNVGDAFETVNLIAETEAPEGSPNASIRLGSQESVGLKIQNEDGANGVDVAVQIKEMVFEGQAPENEEEWVGLDGFRESNPVNVAQGANQVFELNTGWEHNRLRLRARSSAGGGTDADLRAFITGKEE